MPKKPTKKPTASGLRVNGRIVFSEAGVREVCRQLQYVATRGSGAGVEPSPRQLLEAVGTGKAVVIAITDDSMIETETIARLRELAEQANADEDFDVAGLLVSLAAGLDAAKSVVRKEDTEQN